MPCPPITASYLSMWDKKGGEARCGMSNDRPSVQRVTDNLCWRRVSLSYKFMTYLRFPQMLALKVLKNLFSSFRFSLLFVLHFTAEPVIRVSVGCIAGLAAASHRYVNVSCRVLYESVMVHRICKTTTPYSNLISCCSC